MYNKPFVSILWFILILLPIGLESQGLSIYHKKFTVEEGLPSNEIYCVFQSSSGLLWLGSDKGLCRYDGFNFKTYTTKEGLPDNVIFKINEDEQGRIWFVTLSNQIGYIKGGNAYATDFHHQIDEVLEPLSNPQVNNFEVLDGEVMLSYLNGLTPTEEHFIRISKNEVNYDIIELKKDRRLAPSPPTTRIKPLGKKSYGYSAEKHSFFSRGLDDLNEHLNEIIKIRKYSDCQNLQNQYFFSVTQWSGELWVHGTCNGILISSPGFREPIHLLEGIQVTDITVDLGGSLWVSSSEHGIVYFPGPHIYQLLLKDQDNTIITKLFPLKDQLIFATVEAFYRLPYLSSGNWECRLGIYANYNIRNFLFNKDNFSAQVRHLAFERPFYTRVLPPDHSRINALCIDANAMFIATKNGVIKRQSGKDDQIFSNLGCSNINVIYSDSIVGILIGCNDGLFHIKEDAVVRYQTTSVSQRIEDILPLDDGVLLATRGDGLLKIENDSLFPLHLPIGESYNVINNLHRGESGDIWISTNKGLLQTSIDQRNLVIKNKFSTFNGLSSPDVYQVFEKDSILYAATSSGLNLIDLSYSPSIKPSLLSVDKIMVNGQAKDLDSLTNLEQNQNNIEIELIATSVGLKRPFRYQYRLEPIQNEWNYSNNRNIQFHALPPGDYKFRAMVFEDKKSKEANISFSINQTLLESSYFKYLLIGTILFLILLFIYQLLRERREHSRLLEATQSYQRQALSAQISPHFLFNTLNSIQNYILKNEKMVAAEYLSQFAELMRTILNNSSSDLVSLKQELEALKKYVHLEQMRYPDSFDFYIQLEDNIETKHFRIPPLILQPFVENAIVHGIVPFDKKGKILLTLGDTKKSIYVSIKDNGCGYDVEAIPGSKDGHGISITKTRIELINQLSQQDSNFSIQSNKSGTIVSFSLPKNLANEEV